jgi:anaerobic ribonucleoside-triphosphate reductase activating protein
MNYRDKESNTSVLINLIYAPVLTLGPGIRIGIWFQGCSIRCKGCISKHTWEFDKKYKKTIAQVIDQINYYSEIYNTKSITISGGEPFDQNSSLYILLKKLKELKFNDILLYSGYKFNYLQKNYGDILKYIDVLIDGPFIESKKTNKIYKGSNNQRMYILNKSLSPIYQEYKKQLKNNKLQVITKDNEIYLIGIPDIDFSKKFSKNLIKKL